MDLIKNKCANELCDNVIDHKNPLQLCKKCYFDPAIAKQRRQEKQADSQINIGTSQGPTGEDPAVEQDPCFGATSAALDEQRNDEFIAIDKAQGNDFSTLFVVDSVPEKTKPSVLDRITMLIGDLKTAPPYTPHITDKSPHTSIAESRHAFVSACYRYWREQHPTEDFSGFEAASKKYWEENHPCIGTNSIPFIYEKFVNELKRAGVTITTYKPENLRDEPVEINEALMEKLKNSPRRIGTDIFGRRPLISPHIRWLQCPRCWWEMPLEEMHDQQKCRVEIRLENHKPSFMATCMRCQSRAYFQVHDVPVGMSRFEHEKEVREQRMKEYNENYLAMMKMAEELPRMLQTMKAILSNDEESIQSARACSRVLGGKVDQTGLKSIGLDYRRLIEREMDEQKAEAEYQANLDSEIANRPGHAL